MFAACKLRGDSACSAEPTRGRVATNAPGVLALRECPAILFFVFEVPPDDVLVAADTDDDDDDADVGGDEEGGS